MPIDTSRIPALEEELVAAKAVRPGGQEPSEGRIAAIEEQLKLHRAELNKSGAPADPAPENASDESTDYESHDEDAKPRRGRQKKVEASEEASQEAPLETADATDDLEVA